MRGLKRSRSAARIAAGHAFVQNLRRGHYELARRLTAAPPGYCIQPARTGYVTCASPDPTLAPVTLDATDPPVVGAGPVLPPGDRGRIEPEAGIVGRTTREPSQDLVAGHGGTPQRLRAVPVTGSAADGVRKPGPGCRWRHCGASFIRGHSRLTVQRLQRSRRHERRRNAIQSLR